MYRKCEFFSTCPMAKYFGQMGWNIVANRYCEGSRNSECVRRKLSLANQQVPEFLFPWDDSFA